MLLGEMQVLTVVKRVDFGVYLAEQATPDDKVLLPFKQVPEGTKVGDKLEVFIYKDSSDRPIATCTKPKLMMNEAKVLKVKEVTKIGAFLDWGLEKDLLLPYKEMCGRIYAGDEILVRLYIDKSSRLCASQKKLYELLETKSPYQVGDEVNGRIYEFAQNFGTFLAVDDKYSAMIKKTEAVDGLKVGDVINAKVVNVKPDGKLDLTIRDKAYIQMEDDAEKVYDIIMEFGGVLPFTDKASPDIIARETGLSKAAFKRAVGRLYKERRITLEERCIRAVQD